MAENEDKGSMKMPESTYIVGEQSQAPSFINLPILFPEMPEPIYIMGDKNRIFKFKDLLNLTRSEFNYVLQKVNSKAIKSSTCYQKKEEVDQNPYTESDKQDEEQVIVEAINTKEEQEDEEDKDGDLPDEAKRWRIILNKLNLYNQKQFFGNPIGLDIVLLANEKQINKLLLACSKDTFIPSEWLFNIFKSIIPVSCEHQYFSVFAYHSWRQPFVGEEIIMTFLANLYLQKDFEKMIERLHQYTDFYDGLNKQIIEDSKMKLLFWQCTGPFIINRPLFANQAINKDANLRTFFFSKVKRVVEETRKEQLARAQKKDYIHNPNINIDYQVLIAPFNSDLIYSAKKVKLSAQDVELLFLLMHIQYNEETHSYNPFIIERILEKIIISNEARLGLEQFINIDFVKKNEEPFVNLITIFLNMSSANNLNQYYNTILLIKKVLLKKDGYQKAIQIINEALQQDSSLLNTPTISKEKGGVKNN